MFLKREVDQERGGEWVRESTLPVGANSPHPVIAAVPLSDTGYVCDVSLLLDRMNDLPDKVQPVAKFSPTALVASRMALLVQWAAWLMP
jgi:hypothetical protein